MNAPAPHPWPAPVTLTGRRAELALLSAEHEEALSEASAEDGLHDLWVSHVPSPEGMGSEIARRLALQRQGTMLPFAIIDRETERAAGMTTYMNVDRAHRRLEIGSTWLRPSLQRTAVNTECKALLLGHAFEVLDCIAVEFRTHRLNRQSRRAIERLGAQLDGILRSHQRMPDGTLRDTAVYSITAPEWPAIRAHLFHELSRRREA